MSATTGNKDLAKAAALKVIRAMADTIREVGEAPAGVVYLALSQYGCSLSQFEMILSVLADGKLIRRTGDLLVWVGPK